jgi:hypothetical protein
LLLLVLAVAYLVDDSGNDDDKAVVFDDDLDEKACVKDISKDRVDGTDASVLLLLVPPESPTHADLVVDSVCALPLVRGSNETSSPELIVSV